MSTKPNSRGLPSAIRLNILRDLTQDAPGATDLPDWYEAEADRYDVGTGQVKHFIGTHMEATATEVRMMKSSIAQQVAAVLGATLTKAVGVFSEAMDAEKAVIRSNRNGDITYQEMVPDWDVKLKGAENMMKVHGGYTDPKLHIEHGVTEELADLSKAQIAVRIMELSREIEADPEIRQIVAAESAGAEAAPGRVERQESGGGQVVLDDGSHEDKGRAGLHPPVQAIPEATVLPADS